LTTCSLVNENPDEGKMLVPEKHFKKINISNEVKSSESSSFTQILQLWILLGSSKRAKTSEKWL